MLLKAPRATSGTAQGTVHPGQQHSGQGSVMLSYTHQTWNEAAGYHHVAATQQKPEVRFVLPPPCTRCEPDGSCWHSPARGAALTQSHRFNQPRSRQCCSPCARRAGSSSRWTGHLCPGVAESLWGEVRVASGGDGYSRQFQQVLQYPSPSAPELLKHLTTWEVPRGSRGRGEKSLGGAGERQELGTKEENQGGEKGALPTHPCHFRYCWKSYYRRMRIISASIHSESMLFKKEAAYALCTSDFSHLFWAQMEHNGISEGGILLSEIEDCF